LGGDVLLEADVDCLVLHEKTTTTLARLSLSFDLTLGRRCRYEQRSSKRHHPVSCWRTEAVSAVQGADADLEELVQRAEDLEVAYGLQTFLANPWIPIPTTILMVIGIRAQAIRTGCEAPEVQAAIHNAVAVMPNLGKDLAVVLDTPVNKEEDDGDLEFVPNAPCID
jgi:hypothetical protein